MKPSANCIDRRPADLFPREHLEPESPLTVSQWADQYRILPKVSGAAESGPWRTDRTPYLRAIMDAFSDPDVREITVKSCTQIGKTEAVLNMIGFAIDHDPDPALMVVPRAEDRDEWARSRVRPMILYSPALARHTTGREDDLSGKVYRLDQMELKFAGANSASDLAMRPVRYFFGDEVNKWPKLLRREASPIKLASERQHTYRDHHAKRVLVSTPTDRSGAISVEYAASSQERYYVPCLHCGTYQPLVFRTEDGPGRGRLRWPDGKSADEIRRERLAWYECGYCKREITEHHKEAMLAKGEWVPRGARVNEQGEVEDVPQSSHRGFHLTALYSPWLTWSDVAAEFLESKDIIEKLMNFVNSWLGEEWTEKAQETKPSHLKTRAGSYAFGLAPSGAVLLTAGADVQKDHVWFAIRAWGYGEQSWLVRYGHVETLDDLWTVLLETNYARDGAGEPLMVSLACVDSGFRTDEVYWFCRRASEVLRPIKGQQHLPGAPLRPTRLDFDASGKPIPGGLTLWNLDTHHFKDKLSRLIHTKPGDPGEWWLPQGLEQDYFDQMTAEHKITLRNKTTGRVSEEWEPISESRPNHLWDCEYMAVAAADMLQVFAMRPDDGTVQTYQPRQDNRPTWISGQPVASARRRRGWLRP